ncbi:MAG: ABC transporter permease [Chloroflexia bacterium]|nr:ABC transporter permease [Chloroflexia bacterium]
MGNLIAVRLISIVPVMFGVVATVFVALRILPGDPVDIMATDMAMSAEDMQRLREQYGFNDPIPVQFFNYLFEILRGDLGRSVFSNQPVIDQLLAQLPATVQLALASMLVGILIGVPLGVVAALNRRRWIDHLAMLVSLGGVSMPSFWLGILLIWLFGVRLGWFPISGSSSAKHLVLPAITLGFSSAAVIARLVRSSLIEVLGQDHVRTARAKGLRERYVIAFHGLRNALIPAASIIGIQTGQLLGGAVIVEIVFTRQGVGNLFVDALLRKDFPVVQGALFLITFAYVLTNLIVDIAYGYLDPRIRVQ